MKQGTSIRAGTAWLLSGNLSRRVLEFLFGVILARLLLPADFGVLITIQIFTGAAGFIAGGGMGQALIRAKVAEKILANWENELSRFVKVMPTDYKRVLMEMANDETKTAAVGS